MTATPQPPTRVRYLVLSSAVLMSLLLYIDRFCLSFVRTYMGADLGVDQGTIGYLFSSFFFVYGIAQVPTGWFSDRIGHRAALTIYILAWSLFTFLVGMANGMVALAVCFAGLGLAQAGAYPTAGSMIGKWMPISTRAVSSSMIGLAGRFGGSVVFVLSASLMLLFVPLGTPVEFAAVDVRDPFAVAKKLAPQKDAAPTAQRVLWDNLPEPSQKTILSIVERGTGPEAAPGKTATAAPVAKATPEEIESIAVGLNALVKSKTLTESRIEPTHPFARLKSLPAEAVSLIASKNAGTPWTDLQTERFNRFIVEAVAGTAVRQIFERGWRPVFWVMGVVGLVVAGMVWLAFRDHPSEHPWINPSELALINAGRTEQTVSRAAGGIPIWALLSNPGMWANSVMQFTHNIGWLVLQTDFSVYLLGVHGVPIEQRARLAALPPLAGIAGLFLGGLMTDALTRRVGLRWGRRLPLILTKVGAVAAYVMLQRATDPITATIAACIAYFFLDMGISAIWAYCQDVGGKHVGSVLGFGNMWGNLGASAAPFIYLYILTDAPTLANWNWLFGMAAGCLFLAAFAALGIDSTAKVFHEPTPASKVD